MKSAVKAQLQEPNVLGAVPDRPAPLATPRGLSVWFHRQQTREALAGYLFATPWLIGFFGFLVFPLGFSLWYSFTNYSILGPKKFVGLSNYVALVHDPLVKLSAFNTAYMVVIGVPVGIGLGLLLALLMDVEVSGTSVYRMLLYVPAATPVVAGTLLWVWVLNGQGGLLNDVLSFVHLGSPNWLGTPQWSKPSILIMTVWAGTGPTVLILVAGLKNIPVSLYEAAVLDGASRVRRFRSYHTADAQPDVVFFDGNGPHWRFSDLYPGLRGHEWWPGQLHIVLRLLLVQRRLR